MSEVQTALARPALASPAPAGLGVALAALPLIGMITVRGDFEDPSFGAAVEAVTGGDIPGLRKVLRDGERGVLWMSSDELLLIVPYAEADALVAQFDALTADTHALAVNVSDARALFRIEGAKARHVLAKGAPVDLSLEAFPVGTIRRTRVGLVAAAFWRVSEERFELVCFRSVADYMWRWLSSAAQEDGLCDLDA